MRHKLQIGKLSDSTHVVIEDENGVMVATTIGDIDHEKLANEIVTAVNVMPEVIDMLKFTIEVNHDPIEGTECLVCFETPHRSDCRIARAEELLEKLESVS